ncbi:hypothetical protein ES703_79657 [subsurface metagenome]
MRIEDLMLTALICLIGIQGIDWEYHVLEGQYCQSTSEVTG